MRSGGARTSGRKHATLRAAERCRKKHAAESVTTVLLGDPRPLSRQPAVPKQHCARMVTIVARRLLGVCVLDPALRVLQRAELIGGGPNMSLHPLQPHKATFQTHRLPVDVTIKDTLRYT